MYSRVTHILPYLYYRCYQYYEKNENNGTSHISAYICMTVIEAIYVITFVIFPLDHILSDGALGGFLRASIASYTRFGVILMLFPFFYLIYKLEKKRRDKYIEMMSIWKNESLFQRRKKFWILIFFCIFPFIAFASYMSIFGRFSQRPNYNKVEQYKIEKVERPNVENSKKPPIQFEEIDDSHMWGIKKTDKEIRIIEENQ